MLSVAITGMGVVAPTGMGLAELGDAFRAGLLLENAMVSADLSSHLEEAQLVAFDRSSQLAVVAAKLAQVDAGSPSYADACLGVSLGNTFGCLPAQVELDRVVLTEGPQALRGSLFPYAAFNAAAANIAIVLHAKGPNFTIATGSAAGTDACVEAARQIQDGTAKAVLAGGVEAVGADLRMWRGKLERSAPMGEGAAVLMLESKDAATRRGARVHGVLVGASTRVADDDSRESHASALVLASRTALAEAGIAPEAIGLVVGEHALVQELFEGRIVPSLTASAILGDTQSAAGAFQIVLAILAEQRAGKPALCLSLSPEGVASALVIQS